MAQVPEVSPQVQAVLSRIELQVYQLASDREKRLIYLDKKNPDHQKIVGEILDTLIEILGIRNQPSKRMCQVIATMIWRQYLSLAPVEIYLAFELGLTGVTEVKKTDHFQSFDIPYITGFLNPYMRYRATVLKKIADEQNKFLEAPVLPSPQILKSNRDKYIDHIANCYIAFMQGGPFEITMAGYMYDFIFNDLKVKIYSKDERLQAKQKAIPMVQLEMQRRYSGADNVRKLSGIMKSLQESGSETEQYVVIQAKELLIFDWFEEERNTGTSDSQLANQLKRKADEGEKQKA